MQRLFAVAALSLLIPCASVAQAPPQQIPFEGIDFLKPPADMHLGEVAGVAVNAKKPPLRLPARQHHRPGLWRGGRAAAGVRTRTASSSARSASTSTPGPTPTPCGSIPRAISGPPTRARTWSSSSTRPARCTMVFGRKPEASDEDAHPLEHPMPPLAARSTASSARSPTWPGTARATPTSRDGYINSRVAKVDPNGRWLKSWGSFGSEPGQFNTLHSIAIDASGPDLCRRPRQPPHPGVRHRGQAAQDHHDRRALPADAAPAIGNKPSPARRLQRPGNPTMMPGAPWALCITPKGPRGAVPLRLRRLSGPDLQAGPGRPRAGLARRRGQAAQAVRLDPRDRLPVRERALCRRTAELAAAEADPAPGTAPGSFIARASARTASRRPGPWPWTAWKPGAASRRKWRPSSR